MSPKKRKPATKKTQAQKPKKQTKTQPITQTNTPKPPKAPRPTVTLTPQQRLEKEKEYKSIAKRVNQRLVRAEQRGLKHTAGYEEAMQSIARTTSTTNRFQETVSKKLTDQQLINNLITVKNAEKINDYSGQKAKKDMEEIKRRYDQGMSRPIDIEVIDTIWQMRNSNLYGKLEEYLKSKQIVDVVENQEYKSDELEQKVEAYLNRHANSQINDKYFTEYLYGRRDINNQWIP